MARTKNDTHPPAVGESVASGSARHERALFPIVAIGASAGGLEAFSQLLENLPADTGMAFVIIQHLPPTQVSILAELLARKTAMPVLTAHDDQLVEPDHVYVLPPDRDMVLFHGLLNLMQRSMAAGLHLPIDTFMRSLADDQEGRAIGVVLSGAASDGAQGLLAVKAQGGITFAQDPQTAGYDGMPRSAIEAGCVDMILSPAGIAAELARLGAHPYLRPPADSAQEAGVDGGDDLYAKIFVMLRGVFGVDFSNYKLTTIKRRVARRMALYQLTELAQYVDFLRAHPLEIEDLYQDILIMVTEFFRDPSTFTSLRSKVLPHILASKPASAPLRAWVPGCASGEEAYSVAIELARYLAEHGELRPVKVFATDINERDIVVARRASYSPNRLKDVPADYVEAYFDEVDSGYAIKQYVREMCIFARHDVTREAPFSQLDLISCRNLLIYLTPVLQERVLTMFHYALRPGGVLVLGPSESVGSATDLFASLDKKQKMFTRREGPSRLPTEFAHPSGLSHAYQHDLVTAPPGRGEVDPIKQADLLVASEHTPPGVIIDGSFRILQFRGHTEPYLENLPGAPTTDIIAMAKEGLAVELRQGIEEARSSARRVVRERVRIGDSKHLTVVDIVVEPLKGPQGDSYCLILFRPVSEKAGSRRRAGHVQPADEQVTALTDELRLTREHLQTLIFEKEMGLEDLRVANEEIQSGSEELQSTNEELETAKEELQSTNEELRTVNEELGSRNDELTHSNEDLSSLLGGVRLPIIMVDRDLRLRRATPAAERLISMVGSDVGRPITDFKIRLRMDDLETALQQVIETVTPFERQVADDDGHWYSLRLRPYQTRDNRVDGAIMTLIDIDELHRNLERVADYGRLSEGFNKMAETLRSALQSEPSFTTALAHAATGMGADSSSLLARDAKGWLLRCAAGLDKSAVGRHYVDREFPHAALALSARAPVAIGHATSDGDALPSVIGEHHFRSLLVAPTIVRDEVTGVLLFGWQTPSLHINEAQIDFAGKMAALVGFALASLPAH